MPGIRSNRDHRQDTGSDRHMTAIAKHPVDAPTSTAADERRGRSRRRAALIPRGTALGPPGIHRLGRADLLQRRLLRLPVVLRLGRGPADRCTRWDSTTTSRRSPIRSSGRRSATRSIYFVVVFTVQVVGGVLFAAALHSKVFLGNFYKVHHRHPGRRRAGDPGARAHPGVAVATERSTRSSKPSVWARSTQSWLGQSTTSLWW